MRERAFTLIEVLVVITIIMVLVGLLVTLGTQAIFRANSVKTVRRMDQVIEGLVRSGVEEGSSAALLQRRAGLGGVEIFRRHVGTTMAEPDEGTWQDETVRFRFGFPWNREDLIASTDPDATTVTRDGATLRVSTVKLQDLDPLKTVRLLEAAGVLPADDTATAGIDEAAVAWADHANSKPWNDAWGNPIVLAWGLFQPVTEEQTAAANHRYHFSRAVYVAAAAVGPVAPALNGDPSNDAPALWAQANRICQPNATSAWDERAFAIPPWRGIKQARGEGADLGNHGFLSLPHELR